MLIPRSPESFNSLRKALIDNQVVAMACDTIYGLVGRVPDAEPAIRTIKGRGETQPFLQLLHNRDALTQWVDTAQYSEILSLWPGPFTIIFPLKTFGTTAFRVPEDQRLQALIEQVGSPLYSTSVNRTGFSPLGNAKEIELEFGRDLAMVEDSGPLEERQPSTILNVTSKPYRLVRQGAGVLPPALRVKYF